MMSPRRYRLNAVLTALAALWTMAAAAAAQDKPGQGLSGLWLIQPDDFGKREDPPFTPAAMAASEAARKATDEQGKVLSDHSRQCLPIGMPRFMMNEFALEILETPGRVTMVSEASSLVRSVNLKTKTHPADVPPGWNGHSVGWREGQALVIETVNLNDRASHIPRGQMVSDKTRILERLTVSKDGKTLTDEMTFYDPAVLTAPYKSVTHYDRMPADAEIWEYACEVDAPGWSERYANDPQAKIKP